MSELEPADLQEQPTGWCTWLKRAEDLLVCLALTIMMLLPVLSIILRRFNTGIEGASTFVTHLTLIVGMLGGAIAARERRLLSLSVAENVLTGWARTFVRVFSSGVGAAVSTYLTLASYDFVRSTPADRILALGIPLWTVQALLPVGFGLITLRILWRSEDQWRWRIAATAICLSLLAVCYCAFVDVTSPPDWLGPIDSGFLRTIFKIEPEDMLVPGLIVLIAATLMGLPIFAMLGGLALLFFFVEDYKLATSVAIDHYSVVNGESFPALPLFTLAGFLMAEAGASKRLIRVFQALFGSLRGGPAVVTVAVCAFFTSFTGASGVTILALSALLMPVLLNAGYKDRTALGLLTGAGSLGMLFPPCLPVILYAIIADREIEEMFLGGLLPGLLLVVVTGCYGIYKAKSVEAADSEEGRRTVLAYGLALVWEFLIPTVFVLHFVIPGLAMGADGYVDASIALRNTAFFVLLLEVAVYWKLAPRLVCLLESKGMFSEAFQSIRDCRWELRIPMVALIGIFSGWATPVEAAAVTALYTFIVEVCIYRDLHVWRDVPRVMAKCGLLIGGVLLILGVAKGFTNYLIYAQVPDQVVGWVHGHIESKWVFLLCLNGLLIIVGCLMDVFSAIIVVVPLLKPLGDAFGIDPVHLGIIFLANLELGFITPPIGMNLFLSAYRFGRPMTEVCRAIVPILIVQLIGVLLITYIEPLTTWLPHLVLAQGP